MENILLISFILDLCKGVCDMMLPVLHDGGITFHTQFPVAITCRFYVTEDILQVFPQNSLDIPSVQEVNHMMQSHLPTVSTYGEVKRLNAELVHDSPFATHLVGLDDTDARQSSLSCLDDDIILSFPLQVDGMELYGSHQTNE